MSINVVLLRLPRGRPAFGGFGAPLMNFPFLRGVVAVEANGTTVDFDLVMARSDFWVGHEV
ncbi:hypothetical protein [Tardiphaga sp. vice304]|uniref:hypothetical protein n=1 Tax=Tardiphaga sp. vice304 TaxID=2592817 RepID=UPI00143D262E|nr:hypothetical protein [Tardiphaga sp. vice304]